MLRAAARTDPGRVRLNNEDLPLLDAARGIFGVIDGIGGQAGGEVAAATARDVILQRLARPLGTPAERVREAIAIANNEIHRRAESSGELRGMACVITLALVSDGWLTIGHVGDTRLYKIRPDGLRKLTRDHSPVGEREDIGEISEVDAMRHPRRHEVFRDVGSIARDKDEDEFVDVVHEPLEADSVILLCSDGLTDMLPASTITHVVRQHAGDPEGVVDALVAAANAAGGRDNVTVVYAEMPRFAAAVGNGGSAGATTEPIPDAPKEARDSHVPTGDHRRKRTFGQAVMASRITWLALGALTGVVGALALTWWLDRAEVRSPQTFVVGADGPHATIMSASVLAQPGDTLRIEPGVYSELVHLPDGVDLMARVPGTVTVARPPGARATTPGLIISGNRNVRIYGIRFDAPATAVGDVGVRVSSPAAMLELVEITGALGQALALSPAASVTMNGGRVAVTGKLIVVGDDGHATFVNNVLTRTATATDAAITASPAAHLTLRGNAFSGFGTEIIAGVPEPRRRELLDGNFVVPVIRSR
jgi:serine/threonine protein phosphatase PrpC